LIIEAARRRVTVGDPLRQRLNEVKPLRQPFLQQPALRKLPVMLRNRSCVSTFVDRKRITHVVRRLSPSPVCVCVCVCVCVLPLRATHTHTHTHAHRVAYATRSAERSWANAPYVRPAGAWRTLRTFANHRFSSEPHMEGPKGRHMPLSYRFRIF
jgi:hypothetical protein